MSRRAGAGGDPATGPPRQGHTVPHSRLRGAALELFAAYGYEETTVDEIASQAGMSRRTFFRHFPSKEDVIFPDHDTLLAEVAAQLNRRATGSPVAAVCAAMRTVFDSYLAEPDVALQRYQITHTIPALRDREMVSVSRYQRVLTGYLRSRYGRSAEAELRAELAAAAVIAAHNHVLRRWLRRGGTGRPRSDLDRAFDLVCATFGPARGAPERADGDRSVVAVFETSLPVEEIEARIGRIGD